jgi:hypothetical protein
VVEPVVVVLVLVEQAVAAQQKVVDLELALQSIWKGLFPVEVSL